jgi:CHAT domain
MRTLVLKIADQKNGYAIELLDLDAAPDGTLTTKRVAGAVIPAALTPEQEVRAPDDSVLTADLVRQIYGATTGAADEFEALGAFVFHLVARGDVATEWMRLRGEVQRTVLDIAPGLRELHALPWELMYDPDTATHLFLDATPMLRGEPRPISERNPNIDPPAARIAFAPDDWPLRVLIVFAAEPEHPDAPGGNIGARAELEALETLFGAHPFDVEFDVLENPNRSAIAEACRRVVPHVLHFIGHGEARGPPKNHKLLLYHTGDNALGTYSPWASGDIRGDLNSIPLRFAFLNACRTADGSGSDAQQALRGAFTNLSDAFVRIGALGALAMQGDIPGDLAAVFARVFYQQILAGQDVDQAALQARLEVSRKREDVIRRSEWSYPVLRTRVHPSLVLPRPADGTLIKRFVARLPQRRLVCDTIHGRLGTLDAASAGSPHFVAIVGREDAGKSYLAKWCAQVCARNNLRAPYVEFARNESVDVIAALRWIRDGARPPSTPGPIKPSPNAVLPAQAFRRFNWHLNNHLRGVKDVPALPDDPAEIVDEGIPLAQCPAPVETIIADTMSQFCLALEEAAKPDGLVLVLDQVEGLEKTTLTQWLPRGLFQPVASGNAKGVHIIAATRQAAGDPPPTFGLTSGNPTIVNVDYFAPRDFERIARALALQWSAAAYNDIRDLLPALTRKYIGQNPWPASVLKRVDRLCKAFE